MNSRLWLLLLLLLLLLLQMTIMNMKVAMMMLIVLVGAGVGDLKYRFCQRLHTKLIHFMDVFFFFFCKCSFFKSPSRNRSLAVVLVYGSIYFESDLFW